MQRRELYPEIQPYETGFLDVSGPHEVYYEQYGNPDGKPAVFIHGGPGGGCMENDARFFDPAAYRIVLFDQRGCGRSRPHASLEDNTTWHLVDDIEHLRQHLEIDRWLVFGGSWGSTLSLIYAETHPESVNALVVRGIFLMRQSELDWLYTRGTSEVFPEYWQDFIAPIPPEERDDLLAAYHRRLMSDDEAVAAAAAKAWSVWEGATSFLHISQKYIEKFGEEKFAVAIARIETHYFVNRGFLKSENQILEDVEKIRKIPGVIVQGRYDMLCPPVTAWELHQVWPEADLRIVPDAGHSSQEPGTIHELVSATDRFR